MSGCGRHLHSDISEICIRSAEKSFMPECLTFTQLGNSVTQKRSVKDPELSETCRFSSVAYLICPIWVC